MYMSVYYTYGSISIFSTTGTQKNSTTGTQKSFICSSFNHQPLLHKKSKMSSPATTRSSDDLALSRKRRTLGMVAVVLVLAAGTAVGLGVYFGTKSENGPSAFNGGIAIMPVNRITRPPTNAPDSPSPTISDSVTDAPVTAPVDADTPNNKNGNRATPAPVEATSTPEETSAPVPTAPPEPTNAPITLSPAASPLLQFISTVALQGGAEFQNSTSYQSQSLAWLENNINLATYSDAQKIQRYALGCIYFSTYEVLNLVRPVKAPTWTVTTGWMTDDAECTWWSISCDANGNVASIALNQNDLSGRFPEEVTLLASTLVELKLGNDFVNNIGDEMSFLGELTKLSKCFCCALRCFLNSGSGSPLTFHPKQLNWIFRMPISNTLAFPHF